MELCPQVKVELTTTQLITKLSLLFRKIIIADSEAEKKEQVKNGIYTFSQDELSLLEKILHSSDSRMLNFLSEPLSVRSESKAETLLNDKCFATQSIKDRLQTLYENGTVEMLDAFRLHEQMETVLVNTNIWNRSNQEALL